MLCHSHPAALPLSWQLLNCSQSACSSQLSPLVPEHALLGVREKKKEDLAGQIKSSENNNKISEKTSDLCQTELNVFLGCKVQSPKHLTPGWQVTPGLQILQAQTGDPGSGTEAHNLN